MDPTKRESFLAALQNIVGAPHVLTDPSLFAGALVEPRGLYHGKALALVRPGGTKEVAAVAALCNEARIGMVPQGGDTGLVGGQIPDMSGEEIIISTQRLRAVREVDLDGDVMICEAGVTLAEARAAAHSADRLFPLSLASEGTCTIGGNISTNAGGVTVIAYGNTRDLVTGVEAVLADGRIVNALSKLRKDNTGYDLKSLFVGAEGTLGIVTAASLRLFPNPRARATAFVGLKSLEDALTLLRGARERLGATITSFELIGRSAYDIAIRHGGARAPCKARMTGTFLSRLPRRRRAGSTKPSPERLRRRWSRASSKTPQSPPRSSSARPSGNCASACPKRRARKAVRSSTTSRSRSGACRPSSERRRPRSKRSRPAPAWSPSVTSATATFTSTCRSRSAPTSRLFSIAGTG